MSRDYIKIKTPSPLPSQTHHLRDLNDDFWKKWVFFHLLSFYKNSNVEELKSKILTELGKDNPRTEREIAKFIRSYLKNNRLFDSNFDIFGEITNDEEVEGNYDILINNTYWKNGFYFECKNLSLVPKKNLVNKYVYCKIYPKVGVVRNDGGVYRYFNGKYAQHQNFGGMIGFVLENDITDIKTKIWEKLKIKFDTSPDGDLNKIKDKSIENNAFTFDSVHTRFGADFTIHHILFDFKVT